MLLPVTMADVATVVVPVTTVLLVTVMPVVVLELVVVIILAVALVPHSKVAALACVPANASNANTQKTKASLGKNAETLCKLNTAVTHSTKHNPKNARVENR